MQKAKDHGYRIGKTNGDETRADCGLWDEGENKDGGSANLKAYLSL
jgi:hypothetical protein